MRTYYSLQDAMTAHDQRLERPFICPSHDDHNASASVNVAKGLWVCYTCGAKGRVTGSFDEELDLRVIDDLLAEPRTLAPNFMDFYTAGPVHPYWLSRFTEDACRHFQLGYDPVSQRPCYPVWDEYGRLLGVCTRNPDGDGPKYRYPTGVKVHQLLFNYTPAERDVVVLCEGAMDVISCWEAGYDAFGIYGSTLGHRQAELVRSCAPRLVVLAFDNDRAGRKCTEEACQRLGVDTVSLPWSEYEQYGDIAELPVTVRSTLLDSLAL